VALRAVTRVPGVRLLLPGWPDAGRRIVQGPHIDALLSRAVRDAGTPRRALNAGVGEGLYTPLLRRHIGATTLLEFDYAVPPPGLERDGAAHRFSASLTAVPIPSGTVDLVVCTEVLEHVLDDDAAVGELRRVLSRGGRLLLSVPTPPAVPDAAHVREGYNLSELGSLFARHGLEILEARHCMHGCFQFVLRYWRPRVVPLCAIVALAWCDRLVRPGPPMDLIVLARVRS